MVVVIQKIYSPATVTLIDIDKHNTPLLTKSPLTYDLQSTINARFFFGFCRKLARTKPQQIKNKSNAHNRCTVAIATLPAKGIIVSKIILVIDLLMLV